LFDASLGHFFVGEIREAMDLIRLARTLVGRAAIATAAGPAHHGASRNLSVANHAYVSTAMEARETAVPATSAASDSRDDEEECKPDESEDCEGDSVTELLSVIQVVTSNYGALHFAAESSPRQTERAWASVLMLAMKAVHAACPVMPLAFAKAATCRSRSPPSKDQDGSPADTW
jgi:hypothetical protein